MPVAETLAAGRTERDAWQDHTFEPDPPIWIPRIWMVTRSGTDEVVLGWARRAAGGHTYRGLLMVERIEPGYGLLLSTYDGTADDVRTCARPRDIGIPYPEAAALGDALWNSLDPELRVAAFTGTPKQIRELGPKTKPPTTDLGE